MKIRNAGQKLLQILFTGYLQFLEKTITINWQENTQYGDSQIFGFWHEDSFFMNLVLKSLACKTSPVDVIVTADARGNYIEHMVEHCGGRALRIPDGYKAFHFIRSILQDSYEKTRSLAVALDGPLGPRHQPKKLAFYLSEQAEEEFVGISVSYSSCIRLNHRWDKYVIPLPFTTVTVHLQSYGVVKKNEIPVLPADAEVQECGILVREF